MGDALSSVESYYFSLQSQLDLLLAACTTQQQRDALMSQYVAARQNYWSCINKMFHNDDPAVIALVTQLKAAEALVKQSVAQMGDISKVIDGITKAVAIGVQIAAKAATL
ncbi:hypothetical protein [Granulicella arctica]|uniref:Uncharacterized protein n=1 Tax=Granulicella arctica TaxID=940613 RepID=A0A7Y9TEU6_9BACT|nr:hypothetical protein [Granulicella arctica]NYF78056.1 hypothetical protein [Granulicella arctica]